MGIFITPAEMRELTGFACKAKQIEQLRRMGIPFFINGCGKPVVAVAAIEGRTREAPSAPAWQPAVLTKMGNAVNDSKPHAKKIAGKARGSA